MTAFLDQLRAASGTDEVRRPLPVSGMLAAAGTLGVGLGVLTTLTLIGWVAAPKGTLGEGVPGVFRAACQIWLAAHHAGFAIPGGRVGLLPLGLMIMPAALLYRAGLWMARDADLRVRLPARLPKGTPKDKQNARRRAQLALIARAGISLAAPYALLAGLIALVARNELTQPFLVEVLVGHLLLAFVAGSVAVARTIGPWRVMVRLLPERSRSLVLGTAAAMAILLVAALVLVVGAVVVNFDDIRRLSDVLAPGLIGGVLLLLVEVLYLVNAVVWGLAYITGPGFAIGTGTLVAPTGVKLGTVPTLPLLGALPDSGASPVWVLGVIAIPFLAGAVAGVVVVRIAPTPTLEAAPLWGFACGLAAGAVSGVLAALSGGPLGGARLSAVGPSPWEVAFSVALEVGVAAGITAGVGNWWLMRRSVAVVLVPSAAKSKAAKPKAGARKAVKPIARAFGEVAESRRPLPGHWLDATECDTQPIPVIRDDWADEHASAAAGTFSDVGTPVKKMARRLPRSLLKKGPEKGPEKAAGKGAEPPPRPDIIDENDDRGGHVIYMDPYAWDRD
ncbi:DUF6350 family protein [Thermopolyspora sp. NPDC052614]|uniref:cell division protein PerM n=1 Tax=Thermopolyspora sp. NPDC052614 TaxID=3155682 RepID=UPI003417031D